jgi:hypothetical protein
LSLEIKKFFLKTLSLLELKSKSTYFFERKKSRVCSKSMGENLFTAVYDLKKQLAKKIPHKKKKY